MLRIERLMMMFLNLAFLLEFFFEALFVVGQELENGKCDEIKAD